MITGARVGWTRTLRDEDPAGSSRRRRRRIEAVGRRGKQLVIDLDGGAFLTVHLKMTGQLFVVPALAADRPVQRLALTLDDGRELRFRERASAAGAKDDRRDAYAAASALRTDRGAFHRVAPDDARVVALRELSRTADELREDTRRLGNRLRAQLERYFPQMLALVPAADEPWLWTLLERVPTPAAAARVREAAVARVLTAHRIRRVSAPEVLAALRAPALVVAPGTVEAVSGHVALLVPQLQLVSEHHRRVWRSSRRPWRRWPAPAPTRRVGPRLTANGRRRGGAAADALGTAVRLVRSLPGVGGVIAGALVAEAAGALLAGDYHALRTQGGTAPVTKQSGKQRLVAMRYACNQRLRTALYHWARVSTQHDAAARQYYATLRGRGHSHPRALRSVADRWLRILTAMLATGTPYDGPRFASRMAAP